MVLIANHRRNSLSWGIHWALWRSLSLCIIPLYPLELPRGLPTYLLLQLDSFSFAPRTSRWPLRVHPCNPAVCFISRGWMYWRHLRGIPRPRLARNAGHVLTTDPVLFLKSSTSTTRRSNYHQVTWWTSTCTTRSIDLQTHQYQRISTGAKHLRDQSCSRSIVDGYQQFEHLETALHEYLFCMITRRNHSKRFSALLVTRSCSERHFEQQSRPTSTLSSKFSNVSAIRKLAQPQSTILLRRYSARRQGSRIKWWCVASELKLPSVKRRLWHAASVECWCCVFQLANLVPLYWLPRTGFSRIGIGSILCLHYRYCSGSPNKSLKRGNTVVRPP